MALINKIEKVNHERTSVHMPTECTYYVFSDEKGDKYFTLDTYGSSERMVKDKVSQSMQFTKDSATELIKILQAEFNVKL